MLLACGPLLVGCGAKGQDTPKATVAKMVQALKDGDEGPFMACFDAGAEEQKFLKAMVAAAAGTKKLQDVCRRKFGEETWDETAGSSMADAWAQLDVEKMTFETDGDKATAKIPGRGGRMNLVRKSGVWKIATDDMPSGARMKQMVDMMTRLAEALDKAAAEIDKPSVRKEDVARIVQDAMRGVR